MLQNKILPETILMIFTLSKILNVNMKILRIKYNFKAGKLAIPYDV